MRLINADKLKEHIDKLPALPDGNFAGNHSALKALINMQPTIEPEPKWILCSERLPEKKGMYLVTVKDYVVMEMWSGKGWWATRPVAWMPLPESYQEEQE